MLYVLLLAGLFSSAPPPCPNLNAKNPKLECATIHRATDVVTVDTKREVKAVYRRGFKVPFAQHRKPIEPELWTVLVQVNRKESDPPEELKLVYK